MLIIGGGNIALRRVRTLLCFNFHLRIIAENIHRDLEALAQEYPERIDLERRQFCDGDVSPLQGESFFFVIAATNDHNINQTISAECAGQNIPVSVASSKEESTFYFPAIAKHDTIVAGICSGGNDHHAVRNAAQKIRKVLENDDNTNWQ